MQTLKIHSGLHNCLKFSHSSSCLDKNNLLLKYQPAGCIVTPSYIKAVTIHRTVNESQC